MFNGGVPLSLVVQIHVLGSPQRKRDLRGGRLKEEREAGYVLTR